MTEAQFAAVCAIFSGVAASVAVKLASTVAANEGQLGK